MDWHVTSLLANPFLADAYLERCGNLTRVLTAHIDALDIETVVDFGCGPGFMGDMFADLGSDVTYVDGRMDHLRPLMDQGKKCLLADVHDVNNNDLQADLILCLGLLYHSAHPSQILKNCASIAPIIVVETLCVDLDNPLCVIVDEQSERHDQSLNGWGSYHTPAWVERMLRNVGYVHIMNVSSDMPDVECSDNNFGGFLYQWTGNNDGYCQRRANDTFYSLRRLWIASKEPLNGE
jgi:SAM-dependent methyltransferase